MKIISHGRHFLGTCSECGCTIQVSTIETETKFVSRKYPPDSIGFLGDKTKKLIRFVTCPECGEDIEVGAMS